MSVRKRTQFDTAYGINNPLQSLAPEPIIAQINPNSGYSAPIGTVWVNQAADAYFVLTSIDAGVPNWQAQANGSASQATLTITGGSGTVLEVEANGATLLGGDLAVAGETTFNGNVTVTGDLVANGDFDISSVEAISFTSTANVAGAVTLLANGGTSETVLVQATQGTGAQSIDIVSVVGGVSLEATGNATSTAISLNAPAGGVTVAAATASTIGVTGAGQDLNLSSTGGSIVMTATESAPSAIFINASGALGTVAVTGVGGVAISGTNNAVTVASGTGALSISADAAATTVNVATGAGVKTTTIGSTNTTSTTTVQSGSGTLNVTATNGALNIRSGTGTLGIANDATIQSVNVATGGAAKTVTIGNTSASTAVTINTPTGAPVILTQGASVQGVYVLSGTGDPNTVVTAPQGSLYLRKDGSSSSTRAYINSNGATTWIAVTTAS